MDFRLKVFHSVATNLSFHEGFKRVVYQSASHQQAYS